MKTAKEWRSYLRSQAKVGRPDDVENLFLADYEALESYCKGLEGQVMSPTGFSWKCRAEEAEKALEKKRAKP